MSLRLAVLCALVACALARSAPRPEFNSHWELFKLKHNKKYAPGEELKRRLIWEDRLDFIQKHNLEYDLGRHTFTVGVNHLADLTNEEYRRYYLGFRYNKTAAQGRRSSVATNKAASPYDIPSEVDWRKEGYVTPVKNQGQCGSCWAFSATGSLEGQHFRKTGKLVSLSEQNLVDCVDGGYGCEGGLMDNAFRYVNRNGGIDTESSYPYTAKDGTCKFNPRGVGATDIGFHDVEQGSEQDLQSAVATVGPVSVAIDASQNSFQFYSQGIYNEPDCSSEQLDHGVLTVGYGSKDGVDYWIVKNSWGEDWGDNGYILMSRNQGNQCGIASQASYPLV